MFNRIAEMFGTDVQTIYKSLGIGSTSTSGVYVVKVFTTDVNLRLEDLFWAVVTCIILTLVSLLVTKTFRFFERKLSKKE